MEFQAKMEEDEVNVTLCVNYTHIKKEVRLIFEGIMTESFHELMKDTSLHIQEVQ